jgi:hypothetical protein
MIDACITDHHSGCAQTQKQSRRAAENTPHTHTTHTADILLPAFLPSASAFCLDI